MLLGPVCAQMKGQEKPSFSRKFQNCHILTDGWQHWTNHMSIDIRLVKCVVQTYLSKLTEANVCTVESLLTLLNILSIKVEVCLRTH